MSVASSPPESAIFGSREHLDVSRALSELQARRLVRVSTPDESLIVITVEGLDDRRLHEFMMLCDPVMPKLIVTQQRGARDRHRDLDADGAVTSRHDWG